MPGRDLRLYLLLVCLPAVALTVFAFVQLGQISKARQTAAQVAREGLVERIHARLRETFFDEDKAEAPSPLETRCGELRAALSEEGGVRSPKGFFIWRPKTGIEFAQEVPSEVRAAIGELKTMGDWGKGPKSRKKPPMSDLREFAGHQVVWARDGKRNGRVGGIVFAEDPVEPDFLARALWPVGGVLLALLGGVFIAGAGLLVRTANKERRDNLTKTTFINNTSHELKTPLAGIGLWAELLQAGAVKGDQLQHAYDIIVDENARMKRLVDNLLDYSRLEQGRRRYCYQKVDLALLAEDVVDLVRGDFATHGITVRAEGKAVAWADLDATKQILVNLLGNAAKYAAAGGPVEVVVSVGDERVQVAVLDRGPGMSETARKHAFERFWRGDDQLTSSTGGLGLGLSISDSLAKDMDGHLAVAAREGGGCVFTLDLPAAC